MWACNLCSQPCCFHPNRKRRMYRFASSGETGARCGVPRPLSLFTVVRRLFPLLWVSSTAIPNQVLTNRGIAYASSDTFHQLMMWNGVEVPFEVGIDYIGVSLI